MSFSKLSGNKTSKIVRMELPLNNRKFLLKLFGGKYCDNIMK